MASLYLGSELAKNVSGNFSIDHVPHQLSQLNTAHNKVIRAITCSRKYDKNTKTITHTAPLLKRLNLLNLNDIYYLQLNVIVHRSDLEGTCRAIKIASAYFWNLIPIEIRKINYSRHAFKSKVRNWLISKYDT